jgi:hypothetical protein
MEKMLLYITKSYPSCIAPPLPLLPGHPPAKALSRAFLDQIRSFLHRVASHPVFIRDQGVIQFFSSPAAFEPPISKPASLFSDVSVRVPSPTWSDKLRSLVTSGPKDVDADMERRKDIVAERDFAMRQVTRALERLGQSQCALGAAFSDVAMKATALGAAEGAASDAAAAVINTSFQTQIATSNYDDQRTDRLSALPKLWIALGKRFSFASDLYVDHGNAFCSSFSDFLTIALRQCTNSHVLFLLFCFFSSAGVRCKAVYTL